MGSIPLPLEVVGYLAPWEVGRLASSCREYANEERTSRVWREAAWCRYSVFGMQPQEPKVTETRFHWWSVEDVPRGSSTFPRRTIHGALRGLLDRPAPLKTIALDGAQEDENPIRRGGILAAIARSKGETLECLDLSGVTVVPDAVEECLRLVPNLRSLIMSADTSFVTEDDDVAAFTDVRVVHNGLQYIRWGGCSHHFNPSYSDIRRYLQNYPNLRCLDLSTVGSGVFGYARNLGQRLQNIKHRSGHTSLVSIMLNMADVDVESEGLEDFDESYINALDDPEDQIAKIFSDFF